MSPSNPASVRQLWVLMAVAFVDMIGFTMVQPLLPFYATELGARPRLVGVLMAAYAFAQLATAPLWGRFSDRYGRRPMIIAGLIGSGIAYALFGMADSLWLLLIFRLVQGAGGGTTSVVQAYVADSVSPEDRASGLGWLTAATSAGVMIGPAVGSLSTTLGEEAPGFFAAGLCLINALFASRWLTESRRHQEEPEPGRQRPRLRNAILEVLRHPTSPVASLIWIYAIGMMAFMAMTSILPLYLGAAFGITKQTIGWFFVYVGGVGVIMRAILLGPAVRRFGEVRVVRLGALSLVVGLTLIPLAADIDATRPIQLAVLSLVALFVPVGTALLFPSTTALVSRRAARGETGQTLGVQQSFGGVSRLLAPLWAGVVFEVGIRYPFWLAAALMLGVSTLTWRLQRESPQPAVAGA
ncbi:MAG TPA: MFS transporter [Thermoanaerobaculia bacterium]|nr:MFS transporter [Thermoanaerobaculia bacterium]